MQRHKCQVSVSDRQRFGCRCRFAALRNSSTTTAGDTNESCAIITLPANALMAEIYNSRQRMPAIQDRVDYDVWLHGTPDEALAALKRYPNEHLVAWPVSTKVNSPKNNGPELIKAIG
jgi:putative SOS response-associated peptidase YedK